MRDLGEPVDQRRAQIHAIVKEVYEKTSLPELDFSDTATAFIGKSDQELKKTASLFRLMNKRWLVDIGSRVGTTVARLGLPFVEKMVKDTIFRQFCGGTTLLESQPAIDKLYEHQVLTILDYGAEAKATEDDFNQTMNETIRGIEFAARNPSVPVVSAKITGLGRFGLLEAISAGEPLSKETRKEYKYIVKRIDAICHVASQKGVAVMFDAEESWIQNAIDHLVSLMMRRYNKEKVVVYNTFQLYRKDRLQFLIDSFNQARRHGYLLGAKLVRGAYMEKERARARRLGYASPIHPSKEATDDAYNMAVRFCVDNYEYIASCNASHNQLSARLQAELIARKGIPRDHPHLNFCQLYGMSDNLTFNLAKAGFNVAKYLVYGPVKEVVPYLIRRAQENTSVTGDMTREYRLVAEEMQRRGLA